MDGGRDADGDPKNNCKLTEPERRKRHGQVEKETGAVSCGEIMDVNREVNTAIFGSN